MIHETVRRMINALIVDLVHESSRRIEAAYLKTIDDVRGAGMLVAFSEPMRRETDALKAFLRENLYRHYQSRE